MDKVCGSNVSSSNFVDNFRLLDKSYDRFIQLTFMNHRDGNFMFHNQI